MLKIGYFSKLSRISVRMLRHYDDIGLLKPKVVDKWTGYRYYDEAQLIAAGKIQMLKDLGFGLSMIKELLADSEDSDKIGNLLKAKQKDLITEESELREQIKLIDNAIKNLKKEGDFMNYIVNFKTIPELYVASVRKIIPEYTAEGTLWSILTKEIQNQKCKEDSPCYAISVYHDKEYVENNADVEVRFAVTGSYKDAEEVKFKTVPSVKVASCLFKGAYGQIPAVNEAIARWANENGYEFNGAAFWIYRKGPYETQNPEEFITEVCFPVTKQLSAKS